MNNKAEYRAPSELINNSVTNNNTTAANTEAANTSRRENATNPFIK